VITQKIKIGERSLVIETAENLAEMQSGKFHDGIPTKYILDGKEISYGEMVHTIVRLSRENKESYALSKKDVENLSAQMIDSQKSQIRQHLEAVKDQYLRAGVSADVLAELDESLKKINEFGVRVNE
jgi:hypothetical protein